MPVSAEGRVEHHKLNQVAAQLDYSCRLQSVSSTAEKRVGTKKVRKSVRPRTGAFSRMDKELAKWVRKTRDMGIPIESYMLERLKEPG